MLAAVFAGSGDRSRSQQFVGCVKSLRPDMGGVEVSFLKKQGASYHFPHIADEAIVLLWEVDQVLEAQLDRRRHYFFKF